MSFNVLTIHAELEGMYYQEWFSRFLDHLEHENIVTLDEIAKNYLQNKNMIPVKEITLGTINGRSGTLACAF